MATRRVRWPKRSLTQSMGRSPHSSSPPTDAPPGAAHPPVPTDLWRVAREVGGTHNMELIGPGIGIGILGGLAASAIGRNPDAAGQIRGIAIILAAFAEGLGVLAIVVGLLAIFIK